MEIRSIGNNDMINQTKGQDDNKIVQYSGNDGNGKKENDNIDKKKLDKAVELSNKLLFKDNTHLKFQVHEVTKDIMVQIIDDKTGDVIKEIPPKKIIDMIAKICEAVGIFVDEKR